MDDSGAKLMDLIFGRWRSQILYAGVKLGIFDTLASGPRNAASLAGPLEADAGMLYRLMRGLGCVGLLKEDKARSFSLTPMGAMLSSGHPQSLRAMTLLEEGPEHYGAWKHLPALVKEGKQDGFARELGQPAFDYAAKNPGYGAVFNEAMSSYSGMDNMMVMQALEGYDFSGISHVCDIGGGYGSTLCTLLAERPQLKGTVLDLPNVVGQKELLRAQKMGLAERCSYAGGDMFEEVPRADAYMVKRVIHDWNDAECVQILSNLYRAAPKNGKVWIIEQVVPGPETPHFSKLFDIHMLVWGTGVERTTEEYAGLLEKSGWKYRQTWYPPSQMLGLVEGVKA
jgi:hypothetical protein